MNQYILRAARTSAEISYEKDLIYRRWVALRGGVYVPVSEMTPPNPYLKVPDRDVKTSNGLTLTLINPAYMTRQVNELALEALNFRGHITSLNPIRPENHPDSWEKESLESFENGMHLFYADLDGLKRINDTLGHQEGDHALIELAAILK